MGPVGPRPVLLREVAGARVRVVQADLQGEQSCRAVENKKSWLQRFTLCLCLYLCVWQDKNRVRVILLGLQVLPIQVQVYAMVVLTLEIHMVRHADRQGTQNP